MTPRIRPFRLSAVLLLVALPALAQEAAAKRPITHEDVWLATRLSAPAVSPDGKWAVVGVTEPAYEEKQQVSDLWVVATDGSAEPRRLTSTAGGEGGPTWSPDGTRLAFTARREADEAAQVYVLDMRGGEAQRVTTLTLGARAPRWSPDGQSLLFVSDVYPGAKTEAENKAAAAERKARKWNARVYESFPVRDWDRWLDDRRASLFVQPLAPGSQARDLLAGSSLVAGPGFGGSIGAGSENIAAAWTPDGTGVVFAATANRHESAHADVVQSLYLVPVAGGEPRRLTPDAAGYGAPSFSPDGKVLYATVDPESEKVYSMQRLARWNWPAMDGRAVLTQAFDRAVGTYRPAPDGASVYFLAEDEGYEKLYTVPAAGGAVREVGTLKAGTLTNLAVGGPAASPTLVALWESAVHPPEVVRLDPRTGERTALTRFNAARAAQIDWRPIEAFWFTSTRGARIHNFVALPPGFDPSKKYPLLVLIHGGPHSMWRDQFVIRWNYHLLAAPGYVVLLTNYTGSTGFGERFAQGIQGDPLQGPGDEVNQAADEAIKRYPFIDATRQVAGGASYGGHLANWLAVTTTRYRALVSHAGLFDLKSQWLTSDVVYSRERNMGGPAWEGGAGWREQSPLYRSPQLKTPMLVTAGERDFRVPLNNTLELWSVLQRQRVPSRLVVFPDENHWILKGENSRFFYAEVHAWLAKWLAAPAPGAGGR
jgi:dipeptidyl aminopeptidase/acylaminoacyl peptidase